MSTRSVKSGSLIVAVMSALALVGGACLYSLREPVLEEALPDGEWFKFEAHFTLKETGENISISKVRPCAGAPVLKVNDNGQERLAGFGGVGIHAKVTSRHSAVMVDIPGGSLVCQGGRPLTTEGSPLPGTVSRTGKPLSYVPKDYLPQVVWFEDADDFRFGVIYTSEASYENPNGKLRFHGAKISAATKDDFLSWREEERKTFRPSKVVVRPEGFLVTEVQWHYKDSKIPPERRIATTCSGAFRLEAPDEIRPLIAKAWPAGKPQYWMGNHSGDRDAYQELMSAIYRNDGKSVLFEGFPLRAYTGSFDTHYHGLPTRSGAGQIRRRGGSARPFEVRRPVVHYPIASELMDQNIGPWLLDRNVIVRGDILFDPAQAGFGFCYSANKGSIDLTPENALKAPGVTLSSKRNVCRINGTDIALSMMPMPTAPDGTQCMGHDRAWGERIIFERDNAIWVTVGWAML